MRVVIVQPPIEDFYLTPHRLSALGGFSISAILEKQGHSVRLLNFPLLAKKNRNKPLPAYAGHLKPFLMEEKGPVSYFTRWSRWGPEPDECARQILDHAPHVVLISLFAWAYAEELLDLAQAVKSQSPSMVLMAGGAGVTVNPAYFAQSDYVDLVLQGEGESLFKLYSLNDLRDLVSPGGSCLSRECKIISSNQFCSPSEMEPVFSLTTGGRLHIQASTLLTRGCPRLCRFCSNHLTQGRSIRQIPLEKLEPSFSLWLDRLNLADDMKMTLDLEDDNLLMDKVYAINALDMFRRVWSSKGRPEENLFFTAENGMDYGQLDRDLLDCLIKYGFRQFNFSLASTDKGVLERENRFFAPQNLVRLLEVLKEKNIPGITYFICGLMGDSLEGIGESLKMTGKLSSVTGISLFYPVPGLEGFERNRLLAETSPGLCRGSLAYPWTGSLNEEQLITAFRLSRFINLIKSDQAESHNDLIKLTFKTGRLHTYDRQNKKIPVPFQDGELTEKVLNYFSR